MNSKFRIGIDVGGTFTDLVAFDEQSGQIFLIKVSSTPYDPGDGVINSFKTLMKKQQGDISLFVHASTIGTNLFLGQTGLNIPTGVLITTEGFKDILDIARQRRAELYNPFFKKPDSLIKDYLKFTINERINFKGEVIKGIDDDEVEKLADKLNGEFFDTIAIVFLHSYANPAHEKKVKKILTRILPDKVIMASYEVDPQYREYERMSTTVINTLLVPVISGYLKKIKKKLKALKVNAPFYVMQSNGGLTTIKKASRLPVATIESGPATGVIAAAYWGKMSGIENILSFDMGGTTAKAGTIIKGTPQMLNEYEIGGKVHGGRIVKGSGHPVRYPFVDLAEISGGGGTIAWVEEENCLRVGPLSAGADPGPACYGKGNNPTVTDANLILNRLNPKGLAGGEMKISPESAKNAFMKKIAKPLGISVIEAALGVIEIINTHITRALRLVSIERGYNPADFTLFAFGGAGPMHVAFLAETLGIKNVIIPPNPGVFSAIGLILADFRHDFVNNIMKNIYELTPEILKEKFKDMEKEAVKLLQKEGFEPEQIIVEKKLALRYLGQSYEIMVPLSGLAPLSRCDKKADAIKATIKNFHQRHKEIYGYAVENEPIEIVTAHITATGITQKPEFLKSICNTSFIPSEALIDKRKVFFDKTGWTQTPIYSRDALLSGNFVNGPAVIEQYDTTIVIPPTWNACVDNFFNLYLKEKILC